jgi:ferredoxin
MNNDKHISHINYDKCMSYFNENFGCTICVKVCPFSKVGYDKLHAGYLKMKSKEGPHK